MTLLKRVQWARCMPLALIAAMGVAPLVHAKPFANANDMDKAGPPTTIHKIQPTYMPGNPTCASVFPGSYEFKISSFDGTYTGGNHPDGPMKVTVDSYNTGAGQAFDWSSSNSMVQHIVVKGGPGANIYDYGDPGVSEDNFLHSPVNDNNGKFYGLSHISFCYVPVLPDPELTVNKECRDGPPTPINNGTGGAIYTYDVKVHNTGDGALSNFYVEEALDDMAGISCEITGSYATDIDGKTLIPGLSLAEGADADLVVQCTSEAPLGGQPNHIKITADTEYANEPKVWDDSMSTCDDLAPPDIKISKECGDPMIRLVEVTVDAMPALAVQACVDVTVWNDGTPGVDETLTDVMLVDTVALAAPMELGDLAPGESVSKTLCYYPAAPTGPTMGEANGVSWYSVFTVFDDLAGDDPEALFSNTASVTAAGYFSGTPVGPESDTADCSICYSNTEGLPSECPSPDENPYPLSLMAPN